MENVNELAAALAKAQGAYKPIVKNCTGKVSYPGKDGKPGGSYEFDYADLQSVIEATRQALSSNGLSHSAAVCDSMLTVTLLHSSGQSLSASLAMPSPGVIGWQKYGSAVTYARRYLLTPLLGVASEDDDDANHAEGNSFAKSEKPKPTAAPSQFCTPEQAKELNAALDKLAPWGADATAEQKKSEKLAWVNGIRPRAKPITKFGELSAEEVPGLIAAAIAGEMPNEMPPWMDGKDKNPGKEIK